MVVERVWLGSTEGITTPPSVGDQAMKKSITLSVEQRKRLLAVLKTASTHEKRLRAHLLLLPDQGYLGRGSKHLRVVALRGWDALG